MVLMLLVGIIASLLVSAIAAFILHRIQQRSLAQMQAQQQAWERAQEVQRQQWTVQLERRSLDAEKNLTSLVQQLQAEWRSKETSYISRIESLQKQFETATLQMRIEHELARLLRVEDMPLPTRNQVRNARPDPRRQPPSLEGADLSKRDLSSRYLGHANLRKVTAINANLFMADLSWADLTKADLSGANLSAANLTHADLSNANLEGVDFLVTDLYSAILTGANLRHASNLTAEQLRTAVHDHTTQLDPAIEEALANLQEKQLPKPQVPHALTSVEGNGNSGVAQEQVADTLATEEQAPADADMELFPQHPDEETLAILEEQLADENLLHLGQVSPIIEKQEADVRKPYAQEGGKTSQDEGESGTSVKGTAHSSAAEQASAADSEREEEAERRKDTSENAHVL